MSSSVDILTEETPAGAFELAPPLPPPPCLPAADYSGQQVVVAAEGEEAKESKVTNTTATTTTKADSGGTSSGSGTTIATHQLKCSVTLDKLPKRVRLALTKNSKQNKKKQAQLTNGTTEDHHPPPTPPPHSEDTVAAAILCQYCDRTLSDQQQYQVHQDQEHLTANLGRRASGRTSSINSFPGCSMCNVVSDSKLFTSHSNDLDALFAHLVEKHTDRYFACRPCNERFVDAATFALHTTQVHGRRKSISAPSADPVEDVKVERKVTRQSNHHHHQNSGNGATSQHASKAEEHSPSLSRMAQAQNRFPLRGPARAIKGRLAANSQKANETRNARGAKLSRSTSVSSTGSNTNHTSTGTPPPASGGGLSGSNSKSTSSLPSSNVFDDNFYETITVTVRRNLSKWVDGKIDDKTEGAKEPGAGQGEEEEDAGQVESHSPELLLDHPPPAIRSSLFRTPPVGVQAESEIHEATALSAVTAFPTLLTAEQYGLEGQAGGKIKRMFTKNSWKWKFDFVKKYKYVNEGGKIVKKAKEQNLGQRDLSKLDMWTQLTMRTKHEETKRRSATEESESELDTSTGSGAAIGESVREEKRRQVNQLDTILDSRLLPQIGTEQNEQRLIKLEAGLGEREEQDEETVAAADQLPKKEEEGAAAEQVNDDFPLGLQLKRNPNPTHHKTSLTLSGEWARPRCYVCFGCGAKFETVKLLQDHKLTEHPHTQTTHYEMVGRELIEGDLYQHLYIPKNAISKGNEHQKTVAGVSEAPEKPQRMRRNVAASSVFAKIADDATVACSKCKKDCAGRFELYRHMLDCVGDYAWLMAKKRFKYRYYGNRSRRRKSNARSIFGCIRPAKKAVQKERLDRIKRRKMRSRRTKSQKPSDAETIEKMLANLPEKRVSRTVTTPPSSVTKASTSASVTPAKTTPQITPSASVTAAVPASTGKKASQSSSKANNPVANSPSASATAIKRNLRSKLEAEAKAVPSNETAGANGGGKGNKKGKAVADKREVKVPVKEAAAAAPDKSESEKIKDEEMGTGPEGTEAEEKAKQSTNDKVEQQQGAEVEKEEGSEDDPTKKRKTFMTRLASNTKGIIKRIARKMKGKNGKKEQKKNAGHLTETNTAEDGSLPKDSFLEETLAQGPTSKEEKREVEASLPNDESPTVAATKSPVPEDLTKEGGQESIESASVAVKEAVRPADRKSEVLPVSCSSSSSTLNIPTALPALIIQEEERPVSPLQKKNKNNNNSKSTLSLPELCSPQVSPSLSVPSNASNLSSPMTSPTLQKRRVRKLNDCIARLTDKLQEKMSKPLMAAEQATSEEITIPVNPPLNVIRVPEIRPPALLAAALPPLPPKSIVMQYNERPVPLDVPLNLSLKRDSNHSLNSSCLLRLATGPTIATAQVVSSPLVDECEVVDLSVKDKQQKKSDMSVVATNKRLQSPGAAVLEIPRIIPHKPEVVKSPLEEQQQPTNLMRLPEELMKMPFNHLQPPQQQFTANHIIDPNLFNANGELIVPQVPKMGNYEVIKIPTYLPQKPVRGGGGCRRSSNSGSSSKATITAASASTSVQQQQQKKSSTTSAIEKITEMVADIVRNKKREAALKEIAAAAAAAAAVCSPHLQGQLSSVISPIVPVPVQSPATMVSMSRMEDMNLSPVLQAVCHPPMIPLLLPHTLAHMPIPLVVDVTPSPPKKKNNPTGRKRGGKQKTPVVESTSVPLVLISEGSKDPLDEKQVLKAAANQTKGKEEQILSTSEIRTEVIKQIVESASKTVEVTLEPVISATQAVVEEEKDIERPKEVEPVKDVGNSSNPLLLVASDAKPQKKAAKATPKGKKKVVIVEPEPEPEPEEPMESALKEDQNVSIPTTPTRSRRNATIATPASPPETKKKTTTTTKKTKGTAKKLEAEDILLSESIEEVPPVEEISSPTKGNNGKVPKALANKTGKENKKVKIVVPEVEESVSETVLKPVAEVLPVVVDPETDDKPAVEEKPATTTTSTTKVRKKRQSELAQILATQPVINNTERDISLTRRKSICIPDASAKRVDSPKLKPSPPKKYKKDNIEAIPVDPPKTVKVTEKPMAKSMDTDKDSAEVDVEEKITASIVEAVVVAPVTAPLPPTAAAAEEKAIKKVTQKSPPPKGKLKANHKTAKQDTTKETKTEDLPVPQEVEPEKPEQLVETPPEDQLPKNVTPKPKKKRRSELTQIIADQLLESFKEVDEAQKDNLKILHDLSWADETMEIASRLKQSPIPRRQVTKKKPHLVESNSRKSPNVAVAPKQSQPETSSSQKKTIAEVEADNKDTASSDTVDPPLKAPEEQEEYKEMSVPKEEDCEKIETLPIEKDTPNSSSGTSTSLFNPSATATALSLKPVQPTSASEDISLFWKQNVEKETTLVNTDRRLDWVSKASEMSVGVAAKPVTMNELVDESSNLNKQQQLKPSSSSSSTTTTMPASTFVLKPSRLQAIASPPLVVDSFDLLRSCDRSSTSSSFCSPVVSPIGEPKKSLLTATLPTFPGPVTSTSRTATTLPTANALNPNLLQFRDGPREVDESDGDLEDNVSVHSSDSMESSMTSMTKSKAPRKRRKRSLLTKKKAVKANKENGPATVGEKFHCEICNKTFEKADRLAKHKITLTHISRLSELEFLNSQNAKAMLVDEQQQAPPQEVQKQESVPAVSLPEVKVPLPDSIPLLPGREYPEPQNVAVGTGAAVTPTPVLVPNHHRSPLMSGMQQQHQSSTLHNVHLEPISSPEQPQQSYLISSGLRQDTPFGAALSNISKRPTINVAGLSQEEKLFYECCNMLKGSDRVGTQSENNSLTPRSNEAVSTWYSKTSTAFAIRSPTSNNYHRQRSPKYAFSKLDLNQFSDISSDSDNTYPSRARPLVNGGGGAPVMVASNFQNIISASHRVEPTAAPGGSNFHPVAQSVGTGAGAGVVSPLRRENIPSAAAEVYSDSDMGDSFPSAPGASDNESYVRTILDRSNNNSSNPNSSGTRPEWGKSHEGAGLSNDQSAAGKVKTKAAMKGFDTFRVSIPTDGLDMDHALNGGHPHGECKLASLADLALRSSTLPLIETAISVLHEEEKTAKEKEDPKKIDVEPEEISADEKDGEEDDDDDDEDKEEEDKTLVTSPIKTPPNTKKPAKNGRKVQQTRTDKNSVGNRLGFKAKKRKGSEGHGSQVATTERVASKSGISGEGQSSKNGLDVYDFDDSQGSTEAPILPMKKSGKTTGEPPQPEDKPAPEPKAAKVTAAAKPRGRKKAAPEVVDAEVLEQSSQVSSDSFSDRDDFNYNSPVVEDSDISSSRGTPVKIPPTPPIKPKSQKKPLDNVQKKCLIMGRIFKNAQKNHKPESAKVVSPPSSPASAAVEEGPPTTTKKPPAKVELDRLFDSLKKEATGPKVPGKKVNSPAAKNGNSGPKKAEPQKSILKKSKAPATIADDDDDRETKKLIAELINDDLAVGQRKSKRKCIQQVNFVETWSSDEYEDFHSTKDIIAMIEANEKKASHGGEATAAASAPAPSQGRKKKVQSATVEEPIKMPEKRAAGKIQNRRKTIGFKETDEDLGRNRKHGGGVRFSPIRDFVVAHKKTQEAKKTKDVPSVTSATVTSGKGKGGGGGDGAKQVGRQKRVSSEKLYYWSSSSSGDEEAAKGGGKSSSGPKAAKGANGKVKLGKETDEAADDDEEDNDSAMEQHGWIVGGSHKKLVTMLAHAKGKKSDGTLKK